LDITIHLNKSELDYQLISLSKQKEDYDRLLYYYGEIDKEVIELKHDVDDKLSRVINLYSLL
jgi:hypothetical protein